MLRKASGSWTHTMGSLTGSARSSQVHRDRGMVVARGQGVGVGSWGLMGQCFHLER